MTAALDFDTLLSLPTEKTIEAAQRRINEIQRIFSLIALVEQFGYAAQHEKVSQLMVALGMQKPGENETVENLLRPSALKSLSMSIGDQIRNKIACLHPYLRAKNRRLRMYIRRIQRNARVLRKVAVAHTTPVV